MRGYLRQKRGRPTGYWELVVEAGRDAATGKRQRIVRGMRGTKREAERALAELVTEVGRGRGTGTSATLAVLLERWLEQVEGTLSPWTLRGYRRLVRARIVPALGELQLRRLDASHLDAYYLKLTKEGLAPASVRQVHAVLRRALGQAVRWRWLDVNPAERASPPPVRRQPLTPPSAEQVMALVAAAGARSPQLAVFLHVAAVTGARRGELCGLRWSDLELEAGEVLIERAIVEDGPELLERTTKTYASRRLALDAGTLDLLRRHRDAMDERAMLCGGTLAPGSFVFSDTADGSTPWRPDRVTLAWRRLCVREEVLGVRLHDLRHFAATRLLTGGVDVRTVSGRLGHSNAATTLGVYAHFMPAADRTAADLLGGLLAQPEPDSEDPPSNNSKRAARPSQRGRSEA